MAEPGILVCDQIDFNQPRVIDAVLNALQKLAKESKRFSPLLVTKVYYFSSELPLPKEPGWYLLLNKKGQPIYAGKAKSLNHRLNSEDGSRNGFANPERRTDPARNFIKIFARLGLIDGLRVCHFTERELCRELDFEAPLSELDRGNVEKFLNVMRCSLRFSLVFQKEKGD